MFVIFILRRECHLYNEEVESPCEDRKNLAIGSVHKGMCRGWEWGGFFTYELSAWSWSSVSYPACSLLPVASSRFVTSGLGERQRDTAAECEHENGMCDPDGPISFADVLEQGHLTKPFVSRAAIVWWIVASCPSLTRVKQNTRTRFMWLFNVLFPLIHLAFSAPFTPPIPNTSHLSIWEGMSFSDRFWSMQIVLECVCVCARRRWATVLLWLKTFLSRFLSHFWNKKTKNLIAFSVALFFVCSVFLPDLYIKNLFVPWKTNQFAEINL